MKILITTGIYPPKIGGPAQYALELGKTLMSKGHSVKIKTFKIENYLPTGIRHLYFFLKIIPTLFTTDLIVTLDTYSVGVPTVLAAKLFSKKCIIRIGGDFLWEQYCERHKKKVLLSNFYSTEVSNFDLKEKIIFKITKLVIHNVSRVVFSTEWQRNIFNDAYNLNLNKVSVVENYYGPKQSNLESDSREFIGSTRPLVLKNLDVLTEVFGRVKENNRDLSLFIKNLNYEDFLRKISRCYAVVLVSVGDVSPNLILEAIRYNRPFICTKEVGIYDRIKNVGIFIDPLNEKEIESAIKYLLVEDNYKKAKEKIRNFDFIHTWDNIADEFITIYQNI